MIKKKCLGFIYCASNPRVLKKIFSNDYFHIKNISNCFEEIYILNLSNLYLFRKKQHGFEKIFKSFKFSDKIKFYNPKNILDLRHFLSDKLFHGILCMKRTMPELYIYYYLKRFSIKLFLISNIGNVQYGDLPSKTNFLKGYLNILWRVFMRRLFIVLNVIGIIPKIEIRFMSNKHWVNLSKTNQSIYNKLCRFFNFSYAKKLITINSRAHDLFYENKFVKNEKYIVLLDEMFNDHQYVRLGSYTDKKKIKIHYKNLIEKLKTISKYYKKKVVICIHPSDDLKIKKKIFSEFLVKQFQTKKYIYQSKLVLFFESSAIIDAIILKKNIMTIFSNALDENQVLHNFHYVKELKIPSIYIDDNLEFDKNTKKKFNYNKKEINKTYNDYINRYIVPDRLSKLGYIKFANIIKKSYF